jgi:hypothetical protein
MDGNCLALEGGGLVWIVQDCSTLFKVVQDCSRLLRASGWGGSSHTGCKPARGSGGVRSKIQGSKINVQACAIGARYVTQGRSKFKVQGSSAQLKGGI